MIGTFCFAAQIERPDLGVQPFEVKIDDAFKARGISRKIETALYKTNRFNILTRQLLEAIDVERETQKNNLDKIVIEQGRAIGADYIARGEITGLAKNTVRAVDENGQPTNKRFTQTKVSYTIKIIAVETGVLVSQDTYVGSVNEIDHHIRNFVRKTFPYEFTILETYKKKKGKPSNKVLLDGGFKEGLYPNVMLEVFEVTEENVDGQILKREVKVGIVYVNKLDTSGHFSLGMIGQGKKEILSKLQAGVPLVCKIPKSFRIFGLKYEYEF